MTADMIADRPAQTIRIRVRPGLALSWAGLALIAVAAVRPSLLAPYAPDAVDPLAALSGPSRAHLFGTDELGRDICSRVVYGAGQSLLIGLGATLIPLVAGALLGVLAATCGRVVDEIIMRITDIFLGFPGLLLALLVLAVLGPGTINAMLAIGIASVPGFARLARGQALIIRDSGYVHASTVLGRSRAAILAQRVLPNALPPVFALATVHTGTAILASSTLGFLGLGAKPPAPEWGAMLSDSRDYLDIAWQTGVFPWLAITGTVIAFTIVGRDLQRRFDGRQADGV